MNLDGNTVEMGADEPVTLDKLYGPLIFFGLRITAEAKTCEWVIERHFGIDSSWREVVRIPGQTETDFVPGIDVSDPLGALLDPEQVGDGSTERPWRTDVITQAVAALRSEFASEET